jgi:hypothetical protein
MLIIIDQTHPNHPDADEIWLHGAKELPKFEGKHILENVSRIIAPHEAAKEATEMFGDKVSVVEEMPTIEP